MGFLMKLSTLAPSKHSILFTMIQNNLVESLSEYFDYYSVYSTDLAIVQENDELGYRKFEHVKLLLFNINCECEGNNKINVREWFESRMLYAKVSRVKELGNRSVHIDPDS